MNYMHTTDQFGNAIPTKALLDYAMRWNFKEWLGVSVLAFTALSVWGSRLFPPVKEPFHDCYTPPVFVTQYVLVHKDRWRTQMVESVWQWPTTMVANTYLTNVVLSVSSMNVTNYWSGPYWTNMGYTPGTNFFVTEKGK